VPELLDAGYDSIKLKGVHVWHDKTAVARQPEEQLRSGVCNDLVMAMRRTPILLLPAAIVSKFYRTLFSVSESRLSGLFSPDSYLFFSNAAKCLALA